MTIVQKESSVCFQTENQCDLQAIHQPDYQIGVWKRRLTPALEMEAEVLAHRDFEAFHFSGSCDNLLTELATFSDDYRLSFSKTLQTDIHQLARWFATLLGTSSVRVLFGRITGDMCQRFHTDIVNLRLLCTYYGPGTLWAEPTAIEEKHVVRGTNEQMIKDPGGIHQVSTGYVALLKGALHEQSQLGGVLHRSPSIQEFGLNRLLLRIDGSRFLDI